MFSAARFGRVCFLALITVCFARIASEHLLSSFSSLPVLVGFGASGEKEGGRMCEWMMMKCSTLRSCCPSQLTLTAAICGKFAS